MLDSRKWLIIGSIIIAILGSIFLTYLNSGGKLSFVVDSYVDAVNTYVIDDNGKKISILQASPEGKIVAGIYLTKVKGGALTQVDRLNVDGPTVYVRLLTRDIASNYVVAEGVYRCDFDRGKAELVWELPVAEKSPDPSAFGIKVARGELSYLTIENNPEKFAIRAVLHKADLNDPTPRRVAAVDHDIAVGFNEFVITADDSIVFTTPDGRLYLASGGLIPPSDETAPPEGDAGESVAALSDEAATDVADATPEVAPAQENPGAPAALPDEDLWFGATTLPGQDDFGREPSGEAPATAGLAATAAPPAGLVLPEARPERVAAPLPAQEQVDVAAVIEGLLNLEAPRTEPVFDDTGLLLLEPRELLRTKLVNLSSDGKNTVYYQDLTQNGLYGLELPDGAFKTVVPNWLELNSAGGAYIEPYDLKNLRFRDDHNFSATLFRSRGDAVLTVFTEGSFQTIAEFANPVGGVALKAALYFLGFMLFFLLVYVLKEIFLIFTQGKIPIVAKMIAVFIPVVAVGLLLTQAFMNSALTQRMIDDQYQELYLISRQQIGAIDPAQLAELDLDDPYGELYYYELRRILTELPAASEIYTQDGRPAQEVHHFGYHWLHKVAQNQLVSLFCEQYYVNVPIDYWYDRNTTQMYYQAALTGQILRGEFRDVAGEWMVLAIPIANENQETVAVLETGITKTALAYAVAQQTGRVRNVFTVVLLVLILLLCGILIRSLGPLKELRERVQEIINGRLGVQTTVRGRDEVAEIGRAFNQMSASVEYHVNELNSLNDGYFRFVPSKMFQILRKSSVIDVRLGDQIQGALTILYFNVVDFDKIARGLTGEGMFAQINLLFSNLIPVVNENGGVVDKFVDAGLVAFYTNGSEQALNTAVSVCQTIDLIGELQEQEPERGPGIRIACGLSHGPVMIGIVGHEERMAATTISEHTNLSGFLRRIAPKYGSRVLTTASVINNVEGFAQKFNARYVGFLRIQASGVTEKLYDIFDGDQEETKTFKKQTKDLFEKGVDLYCAKEFYEARLVFIEVLKRFRGDGAAKEYLYRCDQYYQLADAANVDVAIETF